MDNTHPTDDGAAQTDVNTAVLDAIEHLDGYGDPGGDWDDKQEFQMKAAHDRLAGLDTSDAPRDDAETIRDVVELLAETPNVGPDEWGVIGQTALAELAPLAARAAREPYGPTFEELDDLPALLEPSTPERERAERIYGADHVPDEDVIPHPDPMHHVPVEIEVSEFVLDAVRPRFEDVENPEKIAVLDALVSFVTADEQYRTPDGRDAVDVLLEEIQAEDDELGD